MENRPVPLLLILALPVFLIYLGANTIWDANEAFYVETPRQMVLTGDWVRPTFNAQPRLNKPVLSYWIVAGLYRAFGISVGVERAGIAVGALGIILAAFLIGRALRSTSTGLLAALIMATAPRMVMFSRRIFIDIYTSLFMALALAAFTLALRHPEHRRRYLLLMYVAMGLGFLTKGPVAVVLPGAVLVAWLALERRWADLRHLMLVPGALIVAAIGLSWFVALWQVDGWAPIRGFFIGENLDRFTTSMVPGDRSVFFYVPVLFGDLFPWAPLFAAPFVTAWRPRQPDERPARASIRRLLWLWVVVITGAFTLSATKQDLYIFPVMPAVAALVADALVASRFGADRGAMRSGLVLIAVLSLASAGGIAWVVGGGRYALAGAIPAALAIAAGALAALVGLVRGRPATAVPALAAGFVVFNYLFVARALPDVERFKPVAPLARAFTDHAAPDARLGAYGTMLPSLVYYANHPVEEIALAPRAAIDFLTSPGEAWMLVGGDELADLSTRLPWLCLEAERTYFPFDQKLSAIAAGTVPPPLAMVSNRCR
ncbi:MAG: glycosyltransferase family 39 protein [Vicinamibacterales bacterium]